MFGDNKSVVDSSMQLKAKLHKIHTMLSFHRVRDPIAAGMVTFHFLSGDDNPADILSKHWGYTQIKERLKALSFDTADVKEGEATFQAKGECQVFSMPIAWNSRRFLERHFHRNQPDQETTLSLINDLSLIEAAMSTDTSTSGDVGRTS
jgi:hypothetical protein